VGGLGRYLSIVGMYLVWGSMWMGLWVVVVCGDVWCGMCQDGDCHVTEGWHCRGLHDKSFYVDNCLKTGS